MSISGDKICTYTIEGLLYSLLFFSPLAFGSVEILPLTILESVGFLMLLVWFAKLLFIQEINFIKGALWIPLILFICLVIFQLLSLPKAVLGFLSPKHLYLYANFVPAEAVSKIEYCLTVYKDATLAGLLELLAYAAVFFVLMHTLESKKQIKRLVIFIICLGFLVSIIGMAKNFSYPFINKNHFAGYMEMTIFLAIGYLFTELDLQKKITLSFMAVVMILGLFLSLSRAGLLCFLISLATMFYLLRLRKSTRRRPVLIFGIIILAILFLFILGAEPFLERISTLFKQETITSESRWLVWKNAWKIFRDFPFFGSGLGTFGAVYPMYKTATSQVIFNQAHNDILQLMLECGISGLSLALWFFYAFYKNIFTTWIYRHDSFAKGIGLGGICATLSILLHSFFDFNLQIPANALLFFVIMAITYKCIFLKNRENEINRMASQI